MENNLIKKAKNLEEEDIGDPYWVEDDYLPWGWSQVEPEPEEMLV